MKILEVCAGFKLSYQGGITNYVRALAESLIDEGNTVFVLGDNDDTTFSFNYIGCPSKLNGFVYGPLEDKGNLEWLRSFLKKNQFDIIHIHMCLNIDWNIYDVLKNYNYIVSLHDYFYICPRIVMMPSSRNICEKYDEYKCKKCISYLHRFKIARFISNKISKINGGKEWIIHIPQNITKIRYEKYKKFLEGASYVLPVSTRVEEIYRNSGINANYVVRHIGNISAEDFRNNDIVIYESKVINLVFLGRLTPYKGVNVLFKMADMLNHEKVQIHFWGYAGKYDNALKQHKIINHGKYEQNELPNILKQMDLGLVLPIWEDNGPQVVMEMLNNHLPVIATKMGGIPDFINSSNGYLFNPVSENEIIKAVKYINQISRENIIQMKNNIHRTLTPKEHSTNIMELYKLSCTFAKTK